VFEFGLIGNSLKHSFSEDYFSNRFEKEQIAANYRNYELPNLNVLAELITEKHLSGFNVTIPFKEKIIAHLDSVSKDAAAIGAVNCVKINNGKRFGYNTDFIGFEKSFLRPFSRQPIENLHALICGTGGSSKAVQYCLRKHQIPYQLLSRNRRNHILAYSDVTQKIIETHQLIINTTPVGMFPNTSDFLPLPYQYITHEHFCFDLIYNPEISSFLQKSSNQGATIKNGLQMLHIQADESYKIFFNKDSK
jgi:shikimate dehydrogenase